MPPALKNAIKIALSLGIAALFLWSAFRQVDVPLLVSSIATAHRLPLVAVVLLLLAAILPRALRWRILIRPLDPDVRLGPLVHASLIGYAGNNLLPRAGELARVLAVRRQSSASASGLLATVVVERFVDLLTLLAMAALMLVAIHDDIAREFPWLAGAATTTLVGTVLALAAFLLLAVYGHRGLEFVRALLARLSPAFGDRVAELLAAFLDGMAAVRAPSRYAAILLWTVLLNAAYYLCVYVPLFAFQLDTRYGLGVPEAFVVLVIATLGIVIPTPGGTGTYHYFCSQTLTRLYGVPLEEALAFATVVHGLAYVTYLVAGGPGLVRLVWSRRAETD